MQADDSGQLPGRFFPSSGHFRNDVIAKNQLFSFNMHLIFGGAVGKILMAV
jgi:hypothetical protein